MTLIAGEREPPDPLMEEPKRDRGTRRGANAPQSLEAWLTVIVVAGCLAAFAYEAFFVQRRPRTDFAELVRIYTRVASDLPHDVRIGYVSPGNERRVDGPTGYIAQYAIAPSVLDVQLDAVSFAISPPKSPPSLDRDPRLAEFELVRAYPSGVRTYRRRQ